MKWRKCLELNKKGKKMKNFIIKVKNILNELLSIGRLIGVIRLYNMEIPNYQRKYYKIMFGDRYLHITELSSSYYNDENIRRQRLYEIYDFKTKLVPNNEVASRKLFNMYNELNIKEVVSWGKINKEEVIKNNK